MKEKVVLAYSGGLDTSYCVKYLSEELGLEVYTALANTGGFTDVFYRQTNDTIWRKLVIEKI